MKIPSIAVFEFGLPVNARRPSESTTEGRSIPKQEKTAAASPHDRAIQKPEIKAELAPLVVNGQGLSLRFKKDDLSGIRVIEVVDESGAVVRQIPPDEVVDFVHSLQDHKGIFVARRL